MVLNGRFNHIAVLLLGSIGMYMLSTQIGSFDVGATSTSEMLGYLGCILIFASVVCTLYLRQSGFVIVSALLLLGTTASYYAMYYDIIPHAPYGFQAFFFVFGVFGSIIAMLVYFFALVAQVVRS